MPEPKETADTAKEEEETADDSTTEDTASEEEDKSTKEDERDFDKEIEDERKHGKPDPKKAQESFKNRQAKREESKEGEEDDEDKPLTRKDLAEIEANAYQRANSDRALEIARTLASSDKEATLIFEKWRNRSFPATLTLSQQMEEAYAITNSKKMIGERNEAIRALKNNGRATKVAPSSHRDGPLAAEPKLSDADRSALLSAGFGWDATKRLYSKPLKGGKMHLYRDPKSGRTFTAV